MSSKAVSPTAAALRSSRLFSIPAPLQQSESFNSGLTGTRLSNSATAPWPTQQAISAPRSAMAKGDWGLKRALPLRSTARTSTPAIKLHAVDTREHITDFDSASDHVRTLVKFHELRLPVTRQVDKVEMQQKSVFEPEQDHTDPNVSERDPRTQKKTSRWKYASPDLARVNESNFQEFLDSTVRSRQPEFMAFLRQKAIGQFEEQRARHETLAGERGQSSEKITDITDEHFDEYVRELRTAFVGGPGRNSTNIGSDLSNLVRDFLDMPGAVRENHISDTMDNMVAGKQTATHPSAGLGYLRTDAILANNPIFGPQARVAPQPGRLLRAAETGNRVPERVGIAGFVGNTAVKNAEIERKENTSRVLAFSPTEEEIAAAIREGRTAPASDTKSELVHVKGGNRYWVEARSAEINTAGRVVISARNAPERSIKAHTMDPTLGGKYAMEAESEEQSEQDSRESLHGRERRTAPGDGRNRGTFGLGNLMNDEELHDSPLLKNEWSQLKRN